MNSPQVTKNPLERLYDESLSPDHVAEAKFNLVNYIELLIELDRQNLEWKEQHKNVKDLEKKDSTNNRNALKKQGD